MNHAQWFSLGLAGLCLAAAFVVLGLAATTHDLDGSTLSTLRASESDQQAARRQASNAEDSQFAGIALGIALLGGSAGFAAGALVERHYRRRLEAGR